MTDEDLNKVQQMIDTAIRKAVREHERNVAVISGVAGALGLAFYTHGVVTLVHNQ